MSSTTRTRIWSGISLWLVLRLFDAVVGCLAKGERVPDPVARRVSPRRPGEDLWLGSRGDGLDDLRRQDAVRVDQRLEDDPGRLRRDGRQRLPGGRIDEISWRSQRERHVPIHLGEFEDLRLLPAHREDDDLLLTVQSSARSAGSTR